MTKKEKQEILDLEHKVKNLLGFKKKWLSDKSGFWWEKMYKCRFFSVKLVYHTDDFPYNTLIIEVYKGRDFFGYDKYLEIFKKEKASYTDLCNMNSYWKRESKSWERESNRNRERKQFDKEVKKR